MAIKKSHLLILFVLIFGPPFILRSSLAFVPMVFFVLLSLFSVLYTVLNAATFRLNIRAPDTGRWERESKTDYSVEVNNKSFLVLPHLVLTFCVESCPNFFTEKADYTFILGPKEKKLVEIPMIFKHIGKYQISISSLKFFGFLGSFSLKIKPKWKKMIRVTPKRYDMSGSKIHTTKAVFESEKNVPFKILGGQYSEVRQYVPGDPIKNIHWKLSFHMQTYLTRMLETDAVSGVAMYIDLTIPKEIQGESIADINDCTIECAYSLAFNQLDQGHGIELVYYQRGLLVIRRIKDKDELLEVLEALPPVSPKENNNFIEYGLIERAYQPFSLDNIVVISVNMRPQLIDVAANCRLQGKYPFVCHIRTEKTSDEEVVKLSQRFFSKDVGYQAVGSALELSRFWQGQEDEAMGERKLPSS